jgi:hypothetical protein
MSDIEKMAITKVNKLNDESSVGYLVAAPIESEGQGPYAMTSVLQ